MQSKSITAPDERTGQEGDWIVHQTFTPSDLQLPPEEYAARHGQDWACFSFHLYRFRDPAIRTWINRLHEIFTTEGELERCRERYLTTAEVGVVRKRAAEPF